MKVLITGGAGFVGSRLDVLPGTGGQLPGYRSAELFGRSGRARQPT